MNKLFLFITFFALLTCAQSQSITAAGTIVADMTWNTDTVFVTDDVFVPDSVSLTIAPGVHILVARQKAIQVQGALLAQGTIESPIRFSALDTLYNSDTTSFLGTWKGLFFLDMNLHTDSSILDYCVIEHGGAYGPGHPNKRGGGIFVQNSSKIRISNSVIQHNYAQWSGGGIYLTENSSILIKDNIIRNNAAGNEGGGIMSGEGCSPLIIGNLIIENTATKYVELIPGVFGYNGRGGGVCISTLTDATPPKVIGNVVCNNFSNSGGGVYESSFETHVVSNIITNNIGIGLMAGVTISRSSLLNNTIYNNIDIGVFINSEEINFRNNIIHNNFLYYQQQLVDTIDILYDLEMSDEIFTYNNVGTAKEQISPNYSGDLVNIGEGNINEPPQFVRESAGPGLDYKGYEADWRLVQGDADIDAGTTSGLLDILPEKDAYGGERIQGATIDIGAVEYDPMVSVDAPLAGEETEVGIYPNPFSGQVWIELKNALHTNWDVLIWNEHGQLIASHHLNGSLVGLATSEFPAGVYFCEGRSEDGKRLFMRKMVKGK